MRGQYPAKNRGHFARNLHVINKPGINAKKFLLTEFGSFVAFKQKLIEKINQANSVEYPMIFAIKFAFCMLINL